jgi:hypothetical protein
MFFHVLKDAHAPDKRQHAMMLLEETLAGTKWQDLFTGLYTKIAIPPVSREMTLIELRPLDATETTMPQGVADLCASKDVLIRALARYIFQKEQYTKVAETNIFQAPLSLIPKDADMSEEQSKAMVERMLLLAEVDLFEGLATDDLAAIAGLAKEDTFSTGAIIYKEDEIGNDSLYLVVEGEVELWKRDRLVMKVAGGESFGQVSFLDQGPRPVTAKVGEKRNAIILWIPRDAFTDMMSDRPSLVLGFLSVVAQRMRLLLDRDGRGL